MKRLFFIAAASLMMLASCSQKSDLISVEVPPRPAGQESALGMAADPIEVVRVGFVGDEIDLWWILNKRQRYIKQYNKENLINNKIYFYGNVDDSLKELLIRFGVEVYSFNPPNLETTDSLYYETIYNHYLNKIASFCKLSD